MKNRVIKILIILFSITLVLGVTGFSYAYFSTEVKGEGKNIVLETGNLKLRYTDDTSMSLNDALPGDSIVRTFKVENIGSKKVSYNILWNNLINTINNYDLQIDMKCKSYNSNTLEESGTCDSFYKAVPYSETSTSKSIKKDIEIDTNITQEYTVTITFKNRSYNQNDNLNKKFTGKIDLEEYIDPSPDPIYCTFDGELTQGAEYVNGQYTYRYKQQGNYTSSSSLAWSNISTDGWGVQLTDKASTEAVNSKLCTYINNKPVVSMSYMFHKSQATTLDVSNFDTSKVIDMNHMFWNSKATTLDVSNFDTSKVTNMSYMFSNCQATTLDVSNFDTSKVTDMGTMFSSSQATTIDLSNFDTSNVTNMSLMFQSSRATTLDLSSFNTSKVTNMSSMFYNSKATTLDLSSFDTSSVTNMSYMFFSSKATTLDVSNFDTSKVTNMRSMFSGSQATTLDVSNFDTSKVTDMSKMFYDSTKLKTIYASNKFNTDAVTSSIEMFTHSTNLVGGSGTTYNSSYTDKTYARIDGGTTNPGYFTSK